MTREERPVTSRTHRASTTLQPTPEAWGDVMSSPGGGVERSTLGFVAVAAGGGAMFLADRPGGLPWMTLVAFVPLFMIVLFSASTRLEAACLGAIWAAARFVPLGAAVGVLSLPLPAVAALTVYLLGSFALFAVVVFAVRRANVWVVALVAGSAFVAIEVVDAALPMWGTSLSLATDWVALPWAIRGVVGLAGVHAVAFCIVCAAALVAVGIRRGPRWPAFAGALALLGGALLASKVTRPDRTHGVLRVATVGGESRLVNDAIIDLLADASRRGAKLVVLPEALTEVHAGEKAAFVGTWSERARAAELTVVVPFLDGEHPGNRLAVFGPQGNLVGEYTKRHLVPTAEDYPSGDGALLVFMVDGHRVGAMICQDDNYSDVTRMYALEGVDLLVSPTFEGPLATAPQHLASATLRTIEQPIALARAATRGTSALIAPGGHIVTSAEDTHLGAVLLVGDVPMIARP